jgi:hypothetical protein
VHQVEVNRTSYQRLQQEALDIERRTIIQLRNEYVINDDVLCPKRLGI